MRPQTDSMSVDFVVEQWLESTMASSPVEVERAQRKHKINQLMHRPDAKT